MAGEWLDGKLFKNRWRDEIPEGERGGPVRVFVNCPACNSFWIGGLSSLYWHDLAWGLWPHALVYGFASVGIVWIVHVTLTRLGQYTV